MFFPNARAIANATTVELRSGEERHDIDFRLEPVAVSTVSGRVTGPPEVLSGLAVRLIPDGLEGLQEGFEQATSLVRPDGTFSLVGVVPGRYVLAARTTVSSLRFSGSILGPPGPGLGLTPGLVSMGDITAAFSTLPGSLMRVSFGTRYTTGHEAYSGRLALTVGSSDVPDLVLPLTRGVRISGHVVREDSASLSRLFSVRAEPANGDPALGSPVDRSVSRNPDGAFAIEGLQPGEYFLRVTGTIKTIAAGGDYTERPFDTSAGADIADVVITISATTATLSGRIRDRQGAAVREGTVIVFPTEPARWSQFGFESPRIKATTFFGGRGYEVSVLPAGDYFAIAIDESQRDAWHDPRFFGAAAKLATRVSLEWGKPAVQDLILRQVVIK